MPNQTSLGVDIMPPKKKNIKPSVSPYLKASWDSAIKNITFQKTEQRLSKRRIGECQNESRRGKWILKIQTFNMKWTKTRADLDLNEDGERGAEGSAEREEKRIHRVQCWHLRIVPPASLLSPSSSHAKTMIEKKKNNGGGKLDFEIRLFLSHTQTHEGN